MDAPLSRVPQMDGYGGRSEWQPRPRPSLGRGRRAGLLLPGHGDGPLAVAGVHARWDLGAREGQHAVSGQGAGECGLVHVGRQAVAAVELSGDVAMVILGTGRAQSEALQPLAAAGSPWPPWRRPRPHKVKPMTLSRAVGGGFWAVSRALDLPASLREIWACPGPLAPH